jgi:hypothetical protein
MSCVAKNNPLGVLVVTSKESVAPFVKGLGRRVMWWGGVDG